jgi:DNA-binding IscR family transcriptional regulator
MEWFAIKNYNDIKVGDIVEAFEEVEVRERCNFKVKSSRLKVGTIREMVIYLLEVVR